MLILVTRIENKVGKKYWRKKRKGDKEPKSSVSTRVRLRFSGKIVDFWRHV